MRKTLIQLAKLQEELKDNNFSFFIHDIKEKYVPLDYYKEDKETDTEDKIFITKEDSAFHGVIFVPKIKGLD